MLEHFPLKNPYPHQEKVLAGVGEALKQEGKFILVRAPTGSGKSALAVTIARWASSSSRGGAYLLASRLFLQQQYLEEFPGSLKNLWGKEHYPCTRADRLGLEARDCGGCLAINTRTPSSYVKKHCSTKRYGDLCPYLAAKTAAGEAGVSLSNYETWLAHTNYTGAFSPRKVLIIDEAHALEGRLTNFVSVSVGSRSLRGSEELCRPPDSSRGGEWLSWLASFIRGRLSAEVERYAKASGYSLEEAQRELESFLTGNLPLPQGEDPKARLLRSLALKGRLEKVAKQIASDPENWVCTFERGQKGYLTKVTFKPVLLRSLAHQAMFRWAEKVVFISATLNPGPFLRGLGIRKKEVAAFIDVGSTFPLENRPLLADYCGSMSRASKSTTLPRVVRRVREILEKDHPTEKGCIHTHSYALARELKELTDGTLSGDRILWHLSREQSLDDLLEEFYSSKDKWLASPSCTEGLDGKGERVRAQILLKAPFPYLGDPRVNARKQLPDGQTWYAQETLGALIQAYGRGVRGKEDWAVTYLLDSAFSGVVLGNLNRIPPWFAKTWSKSHPRHWRRVSGRWRLT